LLRIAPGPLHDHGGFFSPCCSRNFPGGGQCRRLDGQHRARRDGADDSARIFQECAAATAAFLAVVRKIERKEKSELRTMNFIRLDSQSLYWRLWQLVRPYWVASPACCC